MAIEATGQVLFDVDCLHRNDGKLGGLLGRPAEECTADFADLLPLVLDEREAIQDRYIATPQGRDRQHHVDAPQGDLGEYRMDVSSRAKVAECNGRPAILHDGNQRRRHRMPRFERNLRLADLRSTTWPRAWPCSTNRVIAGERSNTRITGYPAAVGRHSELGR
ncbi:MAG: hypothetical protein U1F52_01195 [Burkholderiales bacterium]